MASKKNHPHLSDLLVELELGEWEEGYMSSDVESLRVLAKKLSKVAGRDRPWTWRYLRNVLNGNIQSSTEFDLAVTEMLYHIRNQIPGIWAGKVFSKVLSKNYLPEDTVVFGKARMCATPDCSVTFIPKVWNQKYCCQECKRYGANWIERLR